MKGMDAHACVRAWLNMFFCGKDGRKKKKDVVSTSKQTQHRVYIIKSIVNENNHVLRIYRNKIH